MPSGEANALLIRSDDAMVKQVIEAPTKATAWSEVLPFREAELVDG